MVTMHVGDNWIVHSSKNPASPPGVLHFDYTGLRFQWAQAGGTLTVSDFSHHFSHLQTGREKMSDRKLETGSREIKDSERL